MSKKGYERFISVACVNFQTNWGNKRANLQKMKAITFEAAKAGNNIVVFPELPLSGYECDESIEKSNQSCAMHRDLAEAVPGPSNLEMADLARELGIYIIFGMPEQDKEDSAIRYIFSAVIAPNGILGMYRKFPLAPAPNFTGDICFTRGPEIPVWETIYGPIGVFICSKNLLS